jgi:hypothetical protein
MDYLKRIFSGPNAKPEKRYHTFQVKCNRCGEIIDGRIDLDNDLSIEFEGEKRTVYFGRKVLISDSGKCFQQIEVDMKFTSTRTLIEQEIKGGTFVE